MAKEKPEMTEEQEEELRKNPINLYQCCNCKDLEPMMYEEFKHHLLKVHEIKADQLKGKKKLTMHLDGYQWYSYDYEWELVNGLKFLQYIKMARTKDDPMRWEY